MHDDISSINQVISRVFDNIHPDEIEKAVTLSDEWKKILSRIHSADPSKNSHEGENMASHSRVVDLKNNMLLVEADHPGWINLIQFHKAYILKGLQMKFPDLKIKSLAFKLRGQGRDLVDVPVEDPAQIRRRMEEQLEKQEQADRQAGIDLPHKPVSSSQNELPDSLKAIFKSWEDEK